MLLCKLHKMTILCRSIQTSENTSIQRQNATKRHTDPYLPIFDTSIIANQNQIVNKLLHDFKVNFTFCANRTDNCGMIRVLQQYMVVL